MTDSTGPAPLTHRQILAVFVGLMVGLMLSALDQTIVATALPTIVGELGELSHITWVVTAYLLTSTVSVPLWGKLSDAWGRKRLFQIAIVIFMVGSIGSGLSQSILQLTGARALQGLGGGGLLTLALAIVADVVAPRERGRYQGYIAGVFAVASLAGPLIGGFFVDNLSWRWAFFLNVPLALVAMVVTQRNLNVASTSERRRIDFAGAALLVAGVSSLLLFSVLGGQVYAWTSPMVVGLGAAGLLALVLLILQERRAAEPIIPLELFGDRDFSLSIALSFVVGVALFASVFFLPVFLQVVLGMSATRSGLLFLPFMLGMLVASVSGGQLISRLGRYRVFPIVGTGLLAAGFAAMALMHTGTQEWQAASIMLVVGTGVGFVMPVLVMIVQNGVPTEHLGTATSTSHFARMIGGTIGIAAFGALMNLRLDSALSAALPASSLPEGTNPSSLLSTPSAIAALPEPVREAVRAATASSLTLVFAVATVVILLAWIGTLFIREIPLRDTIEPVAAAAPQDRGPLEAAQREATPGVTWRSSRS